ncbi:MAG: tetratricopeptide repeat protein [Candidatus Poribacteria bacterium]|nr:tetratricopeptide repeat protein [Candidatus Poribacteria bacterium]
MKNFFTLFSLTSLVLILVLFTSTAHTEQYVIIDMENGDRLTGIWRGATDTHFEIEYNEQVLRFPLEGHTLSFVSKLENVPDRTAAKHYRNGLALLDLESPDIAKRNFEAALEEFPKFADAHYQLGLLYKIDGDIEKALARFRSVALIDAENFDLVPLLQEIGNNAIATIDTDAAATTDGNAVATTDDNTAAMEKYAQAIDAFQLILKYYPEHEAVPTLSYQTGFLLVENLKDKVAGLELLKNATDQFPTAPEHEKAIYIIGGLQAELGELEKALNILINFSRIYPNSVWVDETYLKQAIIYLQMGDKVNAVNTANLVLQNTDDPTITEQVDDVLQASAWNIFTKDLPDTSIQAIAVDGTSLWVGTPKGIAQFKTSGNGWKAIETGAWLINKSVQPAPDVRAIAVNESEVWVGTRNHGIIRFNKEKHEAKNLTIADGLPSMWIRDIKMDNEEIWFATDAGVVRQNLKTEMQNHYNQENNYIPNDVHSIALTPDTVWVGTSGDDISIFDRETGIWNRQNFIGLEAKTQIVRFDVVSDKIFFSWYNEENKENGFFQANLDGSDGKDSPVSEGIEVETELDDILVTGIVDKKYLWVAANDYVAIYFPDIDKYQEPTIGYPKIVLDDLSIQCIAADKNRVWIGTTQGMLMIDAQKFRQTTE